MDRNVHWEGIQRIQSVGGEQARWEEAAKETLAVQTSKLFESERIQPPSSNLSCTNNPNPKWHYTMLLILVISSYNHICCGQGKNAETYPGPHYLPVEPGINKLNSLYPSGGAESFLGS